MLPLRSVLRPMRWVVLGALGVMLACDRFPAPPASSQPAADNGAAGSDGVPAPCTGAPTTFVTDLDVRPTPDVAEPAARSWWQDPVFGTCVVRVTDRLADRSPDDSSGGLKNEYSRVQSFNADGSRLMVRGTAASWYLYDAESLQPIRKLPIEIDPRWDARDPALAYYSDGTRLMSCNVETGETALVHDFAADFPGRSLAAVWSRYEGSPSRDGRYWGLMAEDQNWQTVAFVVYDLFDDRVIATREVPDMPEVDCVTISPLGTYFLAFDDNNCEPGQLGDDAHPCGLMVYDRDLTSGRSLMRIVGHCDLALDGDGREVLVFQDIDTDHISMLDLASGALTPLVPIDFSHSGLGLHVSGRAFGRPGWVLVSTHAGARPAATWMDDVVFALELRPGGRVVRFAHTHSVFSEAIEQDYWAEPHGSVNPDFTRVLFTSNWGRSGTDEVDMYMIALPADWPGGL